MSEIAPMNSPPGTLPADPSEGRRWLAALVLVMSAHAIPALIAAYWLGPPVISTPVQPAVLIDMAPLAAPPVPPTEQPPDPEQVESETPRPVVQEQTVRTPDLPSPAVAMPADPPPPQREQNQAPAQQTTAPPSRPAPPAQTASSGRATWQGLVLGRLNSFKRYPAEAQARRQQGVPWIRFVMDRDGKVQSASLERSSGYAALDREAVALPRRSQPLPKPPADVEGATIELVVPVEFFIR